MMFLAPKNQQDLSIKSNEISKEMNNAKYQSLIFDEIAQIILPNYQALSISLHYDQNDVRNIKLSRDFQKEQTIFQVPFEHIIDQPKLLSSKLCSYLQYVMRGDVPNWKILGEYDSKLCIPQLIQTNSKTNLLSVFYLFEQRYLAAPDQVISWTQKYFDCLPYDYSSMPYHYANLINQYHPELGTTLKEFADSFTMSFQFVRDFIFGKNVDEEYSFRKYLMIFSEDWQYLHQTYCQQFTFDHFQWAYFTWKTRAFDKILHEKEQLSTLYAPIIDMINHSVIKQNAQWEFSQSEKKVIVRSIKAIQKDQELYINYGQREVQQFFKDYGFIDDGQRCRVRLKCQSLSEEITFVLGMSSSESQFSLEIKDKLPQLPNFLDQAQMVQELKLQIKALLEEKSGKLQKLKAEEVTNQWSNDEKTVLTQVSKIIQKQIEVLSRMQQHFVQLY